jgi:hypothetical protein
LFNVFSFISFLFWWWALKIKVLSLVNSHYLSNSPPFVRSSFLTEHFPGDYATTYQLGSGRDCGNEPPFTFNDLECCCLWEYTYNRNSEKCEKAVIVDPTNGRSTARATTQAPTTVRATTKYVLSWLFVLGVSLWWRGKGVHLVPFYPFN